MTAAGSDGQPCDSVCASLGCTDGCSADGPGVPTPVAGSDGQQERKAPHVDTWSVLIQAEATCPTCDASATPAPIGSPSGSDTGKLRRWARQHAQDNPGHMATVEVMHGRAYQVSS